MHESVLVSGRDTLLVAVPFGLIIFVQFFRLDTLVASSRRPKREVRRFCGPDAVGETVLSDPDGRAVRSHRSVQRSRTATAAGGVAIEPRIERSGESSSTAGRQIIPTELLM